MIESSAKLDSVTEISPLLVTLSLVSLLPLIIGMEDMDFPVLEISSSNMFFFAGLGLCFLTFLKTIFSLNLGTGA